MQISYLADRPEFVATLARGLWEQWRWITPELSLADRTAKLESHLNRSVLPIAWVAHSNAEPFGTAALRIHDLEGREDLTPWLGGVYVAPEHRQRGIGPALCAVVERNAWALGFDELYLFTLDRVAWYAALGWGSPKTATWRARRGTIMRKCRPV